MINFSAPMDYQDISLNLTFGSTLTRIPVDIPIEDDNIVESIENFFSELTLVTIGANVVLSPQQTEIRINDDDGEYNTHVALFFPTELLTQKALILPYLFL